MNRAQKVAVALIVGALFLVGAAFGIAALKARIHLSDLSQRIVLVEIDELTFKELGRWPFERQIHATAINQLRQAGAQVVIYNIMFRPTGAADAPVLQALTKDGPPTLFPRVDEKQEFIRAPSVHYGQAIAQLRMPEAFILRDQPSGNLHAVAMASCLVLRVNPCNPIESSIKLTAPPKPFVRIAFQDLLKAEPSLAKQIKNKIVIVGGVNDGPASMRSRDGVRVTDPQVLGETMISLLLNKI